MTQQTLAPQDLNRYLALPVTVISKPITAIRDNKSANERKLPKCEWAITIQPVVDGQKQLVGIRKRHTMMDMARLSELDGAFHADAPDTLDELCRDFPKLPADAPVSQAQALFELGQWQHIPLVDNQGRYTGHCASRKRLNELLNGTARPVRIGGLATPLGVYMTSGLYSAGAGLKGLIATGLLFAVAAHLLDFWVMIVISFLTALFPQIIRYNEGMQMALEVVIALSSFLILLRLTPMSGLHAAEHMTINAMESDLPLQPAYVRLQSREHPRCGTNLMVLLGGLEITGLLLYAFWRLANLFEIAIFICVSLFLVFKFWQPAGLWLQRHFTTKKPSDAQLASGIQAGEELLQKYRDLPHPFPSLWQRLFGSGIVHMAVTFIGSAWLIGWILEWALGGPRH